MWVLCDECGHAKQRVSFYGVLLHEATCKLRAKKVSNLEMPTVKVEDANKITNDCGITPKLEIPAVEVADGPPSNAFEHKRLSNSESASGTLPPSQVGIENNFGSTFVRDVPAIHGEKTITDIESSPFPQISTPEMGIPTVSRVNSGDMLPQPSELKMPTDIRADVSMNSRVNSDIFEEYGTKKIKSKVSSKEQMYVTLKAFASQDFWSTRGGSANCVPAGHLEKAKKVTVTESPQFHAIPNPKLEIPTVSTVKRDMSEENYLVVPQPPPELDISDGNRMNISAVNRMNRYMSQASSFPKPVPHHKTGSLEGIPQSPNQGGLLSTESLYDLTLLDHFKKCQHKYQRSAWVGYDMMSTWQMVHHNEATLRNLCREKQPSNQNELKLLLMQELGRIESLPNNHSVTELIAETADYFIP